VGAIIYKIGHKPTSVFPIPYILNGTETKGAKRAMISDVLIIGDRMAKGLSIIENELISRSSLGLSKELDIYNWGKRTEGLHRTLKKLQALKIYPSMIIYHGGSEEFYEKKFFLNENKNLAKNLNKYQNPKLRSLIVTLPSTSKIIYSYDKYVSLPKHPKKNISELPARKKQKQMEMAFHIYQGELEELVRFCEEKNIKLIFLTSPLNLDIPPKETCANAEHKDLDQEQKKLNQLIEKGITKEAFIKLREFAMTIPGNARNYFLLGMALKSMGKYQRARKILEQGTAFDCTTWRSNIVLNNIIRNMAIREKITLLDFDKLVNDQFALKQLFENEILPLKEVYVQMQIKLATLINRFFKKQGDFRE
jgi:tetratricopeptide (TPR) repeat protein